MYSNFGVHDYKNVFGILRGLEDRLPFHIFFRFIASIKINNLCVLAYPCVNFKFISYLGLSAFEIQPITLLTVLTLYTPNLSREVYAFDTLITEALNSFVSPRIIGPP
jgi:hypothetical protein